MTILNNDLIEIRSQYAYNGSSKDPKHLKKQIKDAAIAIKLAIRTFKLDESKTQRQ